MKGLIIAAGRGSRLARKGASKPLVPVLGKPIIERIIRTGYQAGIKEFYVVTGFNGDKVRSFLSTLASQLPVSIKHIENDSWQKGNGVSVLKAKDYLKENFVLMMGDHLVDVELLKRFLNLSVRPGEVILAVDKNLNSPFVNPDDVTKVLTNNGKVIDIGKHLKKFNGYDTGLFYCTPAIFDAILKSIEERGDYSLTGGIKVLAGEGKVNGFEVKNYFWIDVDDPVALEKAEVALLENTRNKANDGPVSRYLNRPISIRITRHLARTDLTPNQISIAAFLMSVLAAGFFFLKGYLPLLLGGIIAQVASIVDGCDGEIARVKYLQSDFGGWFDAVLDRYADALLLLGLTWHSYAETNNSVSLLVGFMAIIGSFMVSYTADKYDAMKRFGPGLNFRIGRDIRVFLIFLGSLLNQAFYTLLIIAVLMNAETIRRIYLCRNHEFAQPIKTGN